MTLGLEFTCSIGLADCVASRVAYWWLYSTSSSHCIAQKMEILSGINYLRKTNCPCTLTVMRDRALSSLKSSSSMSSGSDGATEVGGTNTINITYNE